MLPLRILKRVWIRAKVWDFLYSDFFPLGKCILCVNILTSFFRFFMFMRQPTLQILLSCWSLVHQLPTYVPQVLLILLSRYGVAMQDAPFYVFVINIVFYRMSYQLTNHILTFSHFDLHLISKDVLPRLLIIMIHIYCEYRRKQRQGETR